MDRECERCEQTFRPWRTNPGQRFCSPACAQGPSDPFKNQRNCSLRRARKRDVAAERVEPLEIFERDRWRCHMCGCRVSRDYPYPHPQYATLDHLIPLSLDGPHTRANVATACWACNTKKGTRAVGEQLALVG